MRRMGRLLNRNIVLFEPLHAQKAESSDRHRLVALRSELEHARAIAIEARWTAISAGGSAERVLGDLESRIERLRDPDDRGTAARSVRSRDPRRGRGRAPDPDDARAAGRPDGARVRSRPSTAISGCSTCP